MDRQNFNFNNFLTISHISKTDFRIWFHVTFVSHDPFDRRYHMICVTWSVLMIIHLLNQSRNPIYNWPGPPRLGTLIDLEKNRTSRSFCKILCHVTMSSKCHGNVIDAMFLTWPCVNVDKPFRNIEIRAKMIERLTGQWNASIAKM